MRTISQTIRAMSHYKGWELVLYGVVTALLKVAMSFMYDPLIQSFDHESGHVLMAVLVVLVVLQVMLMRVFLIRKNTVFFEIQERITSRMIGSMSSMRGEVLDSRDSGEWLTMMTNDTKQVGYQYAYTVPDIIVGLIGFGVALLYGLMKSWVLTLIILTISTLAIIVSKLLSRQLMDNKRVEQEEQEAFQPMIVNILQNRRLLQVYDKIPFGSQLFKRIFYRYRHAQLRRQRSSIVMESVSMGTGFVLTAIWLSVAFYLIQRGELSLGEFLGFGTLNGNLNWLFFSFPMLYSEYLGKQVSVERVDAFEREYMNDTTWDTADVAFDTLVFDQVAYRYTPDSAVNVLEHLNWSLSSSQKVAIIGESGSGKSTLLKLLTGYYPIQEGTVRLNGEVVQDTRRLSQLMAYVPQRPIVFATTLRENVLMNGMCDDEELLHIIEQTGLSEVVSRLDNGVDTVLEAGVMQNLSEGEIQRIGIARAFVLKRPILVLDEPTSALDRENEQRIVTLMSRTNQTVVLVTHRATSIPEGFECVELVQGRLLPR